MHTMQLIRANVLNKKCLFIYFNATWLKGALINRLKNTFVWLPKKMKVCFPFGMKFGMNGGSFVCLFFVFFFQSIPAKEMQYKS